MSDQWNLTPFFDAVGSDSVAPAGGTVVGFVGAAGTSLVEMAAIHTLAGSGEKIEDTSAVATALETLTHQRSTLVSLSESDAIAVSRLYGESEKPATESVAQQATGIPLTMAAACSNVLEAAVPVAEHAHGSVVTDLTVGLSFVITAACNAIRTVRTNLESAGGRDKNQYGQRAEALLQTIATDVARLEDLLGVEFCQAIGE
jgi:formiminotetrahydrofolate cyclodeaminase